MADHRRLAPIAGETPGSRGLTVVESCWLCGIRLPTDRLIADGGPGCSDVRWYCRDMRGCTERWTARTATSSLGPETPAAPAPRPGKTTARSRAGKAAVPSPAEQTAPQAAAEKLPGPAPSPALTAKTAPR
jgi:hypothetical protein